MYKQIVVGTDGSAGADLAIETAIGQAGAAGGTVHVVMAYKTVNAAQVAMSADAGVMASAGEADAASREGAEQVCQAAVARAEAAGVDAEAHPLESDAAEALLAVAEQVDADLVVVGNRGMSGARRFVLGSVPNKVSHHCPTNLLIVDTSSD